MISIDTEMKNSANFLFSKRFIKFSIREFEKEWNRTISDLDSSYYATDSVQETMNVDQSLAFIGFAHDSFPSEFVDNEMLEDVVNFDFESPPSNMVPPMTPYADIQEADDTIDSLLHVKRSGALTPNPELANLSCMPLIDGTGVPWFSMSSELIVATGLVENDPIISNSNPVPLRAPGAPALQIGRKDGIARPQSARIAHRRKSVPSQTSSVVLNDSCHSYAEPELIEGEMKPAVEELNRKTTASARGRKRTPAPSRIPQTPVACKRVKKYELSDDENPSVRNARAAKANRDKKKKETMELKETVLRQSNQIEVMKLQMTKEKKDLAELKRKYEDLVQHQQATNSMFLIQEELKRYLGAVLPALAATFGGVPSVILAPGVAPTETGPYITAHFNLDSKNLTISNLTNI